MRRYLLGLALGSFVFVAAVGEAQQGGLGVPASSSATSLDYEFFKAQVQPIFVARRPGHARCISCHTEVATFRLEPLPAGVTMWNEEQSKKNFEAARRMVVPGNLRGSRLLIHPLRFEAGGGLVHHTGGKHFDSVNDPEWRVLAAWVRGEKN